MNLFFKVFFRAIYLLLLGLLVCAIAYCRGVTAIRAWMEQGGEPPKSIVLTSYAYGTGRQINLTRVDLISELTREIRHPRYTELIKGNPPVEYFAGRAYFGPLSIGPIKIMIYRGVQAGLFRYPREWDPTADWGHLLITQPEEALAHELWNAFEKDERENK